MLKYSITFNMRQSYLLVRNPITIRVYLRHTSIVRLLSIVLVKSMEENQEKWKSLIEVDRQQSPGRCENESLEERLPAPACGSSALLPSPPLLPDNTLIVSPSLPLSSPRLSPPSKTAPLYFSAGFTNGLVTMEIAAHENLTYSGWGQKFQSFCCGMSFSSPAFSVSLCTLIFFWGGEPFRKLPLMVWMSCGESFW